MNPLTSAQVEYLRPSQVSTTFGFGRSYTYDRIADGSFDSVVIKEAGSERGIRLVSARSIRAFIQSHRHGQ